MISRRQSHELFLSRSWIHILNESYGSIDDLLLVIYKVLISTTTKKSSGLRDLNAIFLNIFKLVKINGLMNAVERN